MTVYSNDVASSSEPSIVRQCWPAAMGVPSAMNERDSAMAFTRLVFPEAFAPNTMADVRMRTPSYSTAWSLWVLTGPAVMSSDCSLQNDLKFSTLNLMSMLLPISLGGLDKLHNNISESNLIVY